MLDNHENDTKISTIIFLALFRFRAVTVGTNTYVTFQDYLGAVNILRFTAWRNEREVAGKKLMHL